MKTRRPGSRMMTALIIALVFALMTFAITAFAEGDAAEAAGPSTYATIVNTIPLWKSQMVLALGLNHSQRAIEAQRQVSDMTNELLKKNADMLKMGTIATAKEAERSIIDIETLQHTNQQLISTLDEVINIQKDGAQKRKEAELELGRIEGELKQKLLELRS